MQIKEKFGGLRWYDNWTTEEVDKIIRRYSCLSYRTCITCGKPAKYRTTGWISPYCEDCLPKNYNYEEIDGSKEN